MTILVTGASGFIGSYIVEDGLRRGYDMWAGIRATSSRKYLTDERIHFAELDLSNPEKLRAQLESYRSQLEGGKWDVVVHAAGVTKCLHEEDFYRVNTLGTKHLVEGLKAAGMIPNRLVFISSLSVYGAIKDKPVPPEQLEANLGWTYKPIEDTDTPCPNTAYGKSKLEAERYLQSQQDVPFTILRPTGVYGPREQDYFMMAASIANHIDFSVGYSRQEITFVYVMDVVAAVFQCMDAPKAIGKGYFLSDGCAYNSRHFSDLLQKYMKVKHVLHIKAPLWFLRVICAFGTQWSRISGKITALNNDKYYILSQRNWQCNTKPAYTDFKYHPEWTLKEGVKATVEWYKKEGWIK